MRDTHHLEQGDRNMNHFNSHERSDLGVSESSLSEATSITGGGGFTIRVKGVTFSFTIAIFFVPVPYTTLAVPNTSACGILWG